jgi:hypothetical protein
MTAPIDPAVAAFDPALAGQPDPAGLQIMASISASLGGIAAAFKAEENRRQQLAHDLWWAPIRPLQANPQTQTAVAGTIVLTDAETWGPKTGYFWAIQRLTVAGLTGTDAVTIYKGSTAGALAAVPQNQVSAALTAATCYFNPGRTTLVMQPGDFLTVYGTGLASTSVTVSADLVIGVLSVLADYLI